MRKWTAATPVIASFALSAIVFTQLPHSATPDLPPLLPISLGKGDAMPRFFIALLLPVLGLLVWVLLTRLASVRTSREPLPGWLLNEGTGASAIERFEPTYGTITFAITSLLFLMHVGLLGSVLAWPSWGYRVLTALIGVGMVAVGNVLPRTRPNWIVGLRTKRTLSDPVVWLNTHRVAGALMIATGIVVVITSAMAPRYSLVSGLVLLLISFPVAVYSGARAVR